MSQVPLPAALFTDLRLGLGADAPVQLERLVTAGWKLMTELRALAEDIEGADAPALLEVLALRLAETFVEIDLDLDGLATGEEHHLALALERGLRAIAPLAPPGLADWLGLADPQAEQLLAACQTLIEAFPGELPDPLTPAGQSPTLRAMRAWSRLGEATGAPLDRLGELMRAV